MRSIVARVLHPTDEQILDLICQGYTVEGVADLGYAFVVCDWYKYANADMVCIYDDDTAVVFYL